MSPANILEFSYDFLLLVSTGMYGWALGTRKDYICILFIYLVLNVVLQATPWIRVALGCNSDVLEFHIFTPIEYASISLVYSRILINKRVRRAIWASIILFFPICLFFSIYIQKINTGNSYVTLIGSALIVCWAFLFLREVVLFNPVTRLTRYPLFWINTGILIYFAENVLFDGVPQYLSMEAVKSLPQLFLLYAGFGCLYLVLITIGAMTELKSTIRKRKLNLNE
jgi:hypothetical protein